MIRAFRPDPMSLQGAGGIDRCDPSKPVLIPEIGVDSDVAPGWMRSVDKNGRPLKPTIRCRCGTLTGIALHRVQADGRVTASFYDSKEPEFSHKGKTYRHPPGCGWHVFIRLAGYDLGEFPAED